MLKILLGVSVAAVVIVIITVLLAVLVINKDKKKSQTVLPGNNTYIPNALILYPDDTYIISDNKGNQTKKTGIQNELDSIWGAQSANEFGKERVLIVFTKGTYELDIKLGYYTQVISTESDASQVVVKGTVSVDNNTNPCIGALDNFFRSMSNFTIEVPNEGTNTFAVSQASPIRSMVIKGDLAVSKFEAGCGSASRGGYSSGGFMSDTQISGKFDLATQQQWYSRNSVFDSTDHAGAWNIVYSGCKGDIDPSVDCSKSPLVTSLEEVEGLSSEAPRFVVDSNGKYSIHRYALVNDSSGVTSSKTTSVNEIFITNPTVSADTVNSEISQGKSIVFSPGYYEYDTSIIVDKSDIVLMGTGFATIVSKKGLPCIIVKDSTENVILSHFILEAGDVYNKGLLLVGETAKQGGSKTKPTMIFDVFARVGGETETATAPMMVEINQNYVVIDHMWCWRADHTKQGASGGVGFDKLKCPHGLVVKGDGVIARALFSEHCTDTNVEWDGDDGIVEFYQSEFAYELPSGAWTNPSMAVTGKNFSGGVLGAYSYSNDQWHDPTNPPIIANGFTSKEESSIQGMFTIMLNPEDSQGEITHVYNDKGATINKDNVGPVYCKSSESTTAVCGACS